MASRGKSIFFLVLFMPFFWASSAPASETPPRQTVEKLLDAIRGLKIENKLSPERQKMNQELSLRALEMLDLQEVSRKALGKYWSKRTPKEQNGFVKLLGRMFVQEAFPNSGKFFSDLKLVYGKIRMKKTKALVPLTVVHQEEGEIAIDFHLYKNGGGWQVTDVDLDEISMRNNLRSQFYKIIDKNDYQDLVRRMEAKLQEIKS